MKKCKLLLAVIMVLSLSLFAISCADADHKHTYSEWEIVTMPTEEAEGLALRSCDECGKVEKEILSPLSDKDFWTIETKDPTHYEKGTKTYKCPYAVIVEDIDIIPHTLGDWIISVKPTETEGGKAEKKCTGCDYKETIDIPALSDTKVWTLAEFVEPDHKKAGHKKYTSEYGEVNVELAVIPHEYTAWEITVAPTKEKTGTATRNCTGCDHVDSVELPVLTDTKVWSLKVVDATHKEKGSETYTSEYGKVVIELPIIPHTMGAWEFTAEPTLDAKGKATRSCTGCDHTETVDVPALSDTAEWTVVKSVDPSYMEEGKVVYNSKTFGDYIVVTNKLTAPFANKTFSYFTINATGSNGAPWKDGNQVYPSRSTGKFKFDEKGCLVNAPAMDEDGNRPVQGDDMGNVFPETNTNEGIYELTMLDNNGKVSYKKYGFKSTPVEVGVQGSWDTAMSEHFILDESGNFVKGKLIDSFEGYVDFETGVVILDKSSKHNYSLTVLLVPNGNAYTRHLTAYAWNDNLAVQYVNGAENATVYVNNNTVHFGVNFEYTFASTDADEEYPLTAKVTGKELSKSFAANKDGVLVETDGLEGTYNVADVPFATMVVNGAGVVTIDNVDYAYNTIANGTISFVVDGVYYEAVIANGECNVEKAMVTVTYETAGQSDLTTDSFNKTVAVKLPTPVSKESVFAGWYLDAEFKTPVVLDDNGNFVPTKDVTLFAKWEAKVVINLVGVPEGSDAKLFVPEGSGIEVLPVYEIGAVKGKKFIGWFEDAEFTNEVFDGIIFTQDVTGVTYYAKWFELPAYYGTYIGTELWGEHWGNSSSLNLTIDENGNISGKYTGVVFGYDPLTQKITWKKNSTDTVSYGLWFNAEIGVIAAYYGGSPTEIGTDFNIFFRDGVKNKVNEHWGINIPETPGATSRGYHAHYVNADTEVGANTEIVIARDNIYYVANGVQSTTADGTALTAVNVKDQKTAILKVNGKAIFAVASEGDTFDKNSTTYDLDEYVGTYTAESGETVVLDGAGGAVVNGAVGTYKLVDGTNNTFDVYVSDNTVYYSFVIGDVCTLTKVMVNVTIKGTAYNDEQVVPANINVKFNAPEFTNDTMVLVGWYFDETHQNAVPVDFAPTQDVALYPLWKEKVTVTINQNFDGKVDELTIEKGISLTLETPMNGNHAFLGWYTTATFDVGSEWENGSVVSADTTLYVKWGDPFVYGNKKYAIFNHTLNGGNGYFGSDSALIAFDPAGNAFAAPKTKKVKDVVVRDYEYDEYTGLTNKFNKYEGFIHIEIVDEVTGKLKVTVTGFKTEKFSTTIEYGSSWYTETANVTLDKFVLDANGNYVKDTNNVKVHDAYIDQTTGIIVFVVKNDLKLATPFEEKVYGTSSMGQTFEDGKTIIRYAYKNVDVDHTIGIFIDSTGVPTFNVTFVDDNGVEIDNAGNQRTPVINIKNADGNVIAKYGYNDANREMQIADGFQGAYTGEKAVVVDGIDEITIDGVAGKYVLSAPDAGHTLTTTVDGVYYEITLNKDDNTAVVVVPVVDVTYEAYGKADVAVMSVNKTIDFKLPVPENADFRFAGWYLEPEFTNKVEGKYATDKAITLYAKWDKKVTLTVVYGNGMENAVINYFANDKTAPVEPAETNGSVFEGWYNEDTFTTPYTPGVILENTTIYCKWKTPHALAGSYKGYNLYNGSAHMFASKREINIDADGVVTGTKSRTIKSYDAETGVVTFTNGDYGYYDSVNGILMSGFSSTVGTDVYVFVRNATSVTVVEEETSNLDSNKTKLFKISFTVAGVTKEFNSLIYGDKIYNNVTIVSGGDFVNAGNASMAPSFKVNDAEGNLIAEFKLGNDVKNPVTGDLYTMGTYSSFTVDVSTAGTPAIVNGDAKDVIKFNASGTTFVKPNYKDNTDWEYGIVEYAKKDPVYALAGWTELSIADKATGKLNYTTTGFKMSGSNFALDYADNFQKDTSKVVTYNAYMDMNSGVIVRFEDNGNTVRVMTFYDTTVDSANVVTNVTEAGVATIAYTTFGTTFNISVNNGVVTFA